MENQVISILYLFLCVILHDCVCSVSPHFSSQWVVDGLCQGQGRLEDATKAQRAKEDVEKEGYVKKGAKDLGFT